MTRLVCICFIFGCLMLTGQSSAKIDPESIMGMWLFNEGQGDIAKDSSKNGNDGKLTNGPKWVQGKCGGALEFDGTDDYVGGFAREYDLGSDDFSIEAWIYPEAYTDRPIISQWHRTDGSWDIRVGWGWGGSAIDTLYFFITETGFSVDQVIFSGPRLTLNEWQHIVVTRRNDMLYMYRNGIESGLGSFDYHIFNSATPPQIGKFPGWTQNYFDGLIDEVAIYNRALTPEEIQAIFDAGEAGKCKLTITSIAPNFGSVCGDTQVVLKGDDFQEGATVSIGGSELVDVTVLPEVAASVTSQSIDITDAAPDAVTLRITLKEKSNPEVTRAITFPTDSAFVANILVLKALIETGIASNPDIAGKIIVSVDGVDSAVAVTFTTVDKGTGVQLSIEQTSGSDVLFSTVVGDEGGSEIIGTTSPGTVGLHDVVVTNLDGESDTLAHGFVYMPLVSDVSGNCEITAYDAALILQFVVGIIDQFPASSPISQAAQKYISGEITIEELDRILKKLGYPSVFKLLGLENQLLQNYPNPFNPETWIPFQLAQNASVTISVYNTKGQLIRTIALGNKQAGIYTSKSKAAYWDGRCSLGEKVASGVYFYMLQAGNFTATRRMLIVK